MIVMKAEPIQSVLARNLRKRRTELGLTQAELAARLGMSQPSLSTLEKGTYAARLDTLDRLAEALDTTPAELLTADVFSAR